MRVFLFFLLTSCAIVPPPTLQPTGNRKVASQEKYGIIVLSDIHVYTTPTSKRPSIVPPNFHALMEKLEVFVDENNVKFIVLLGDCTSGNVNDKYSLSRVKMWWNELKKSLTPLMRKGVQILPVTGNHDYYTQNHKDGYKYAWCLFVGDPKHCASSEGSANPPDDELNLSAPKPEYYSLSYRNLDLFFIHAVDYSIDSEQEAWLQQVTQAKKANNHLKLALGHVALYTRIIQKPYTAFGDRVSHILLDGNIRHYMNGHEHYFWDEFIGAKKFRQTIVGTSSGTYNYAPHLRNYERFCKKLNSDGLKICEMEPDNSKFLTYPSTRLQVYKQMFEYVEVDENTNSYQVTPYAFYKDEIMPFYSL